MWANEMDGVDEGVSGSLELEDLDEKALEMLRGFRADQAVFIAEQLRGASFIGIQNRASFLMAVMRNFRDRLKQLGPQAALAQPLVSGPDPEKLKVNRRCSLELTGIVSTITMNGCGLFRSRRSWIEPATAWK